MRRRIKPIWYVAGPLVALAAANLVFPFVWWLTPVHGRVVDRTTGSPIANAAVAISWSLEGWESSVVDYLHCGEAITGEKGEFRHTVWGPRFHFSQGRVFRTQPEYRVIAEGYVPIQASSNNAGSAFFYAGAQPNSRTFQLEPAIPGETLERAVESFNNSMVFVKQSRKCAWTQTRKRVSNARHGLAKRRSVEPPDGAPRTF